MGFTFKISDDLLVIPNRQRILHEALENFELPLDQCEVLNINGSTFKVLIINGDEAGALLIGLFNLETHGSHEPAQICLILS